MNRKFIHLPVTAFTYRILSSRYGQPIRASRQYNRELFTLLQLAPITSLTEERRTLLTESAAFHVPSELGRAIRQQDMESIGMLMHEHFIREMYLHTYSQVIAGRKAWTALEDFYVMHGITEDDWKFDTAYRKWLHYSTQVEKRNGTEKTVNSRPSQNIRSTVNLLIAELDGHNISPQLIQSCIYDHVNTPIRDARLIEAFLYSQLCQLDPPSIARRMKYTRQNAYLRLQSMEQQLDGATITGRRLVRVLSKIKEQLTRQPTLFS